MLSCDGVASWTWLARRVRAAVGGFCIDAAGAGSDAAGAVDGGVGAGAVGGASRTCGDVVYVDVAAAGALEVSAVVVVGVAVAAAVEAGGAPGAPGRRICGALGLKARPPFFLNMELMVDSRVK